MASAPAYQQQALTFGKAALFHVQRARNWNLQDTTITDRERTQLEALGVRDQTTQRYYAWRRSALIVMLLPLVITAVLAGIDLADLDTTGMTALGQIVAIGPSLVLVFLPFAAILATVSWTNLRFSQRAATGGWLIATTIPIVLATIPVRYLLSSSPDMSEEELATYKQTVFFLGIVMALNYAIQLLPVIVSMPSGVMAGCLRVKSLLPDSVLPGWFLVSVAPFYSMLTLIAFVIISQIAGNALLIIAVALFAISPWVHVYYSKAYVQPSGDGSKLKVWRAQQISGLMNLAAIVLLLIWAPTVKVLDKHLIGFDDGALLKPWDAALKLLEMFSRSLLTAIVFSHIFLQFNRLFWSHAKRFAGSPAEERYDLTMTELDREIR